MAKTLKQVLAVKGLVDAQKERANDWFKAQQRFGKELLMPVNTDAETMEFLNKLVDNYNKRKMRDDKKKAAKAAKATENAAIFEAIEDAKKFGFTVDNIVSAIKATIKEKKNEQLCQKIAELEAQLED